MLTVLPPAAALALLLALLLLPLLLLLLLQPTAAKAIAAKAAIAVVRLMNLPLIYWDCPAAAERTGPAGAGSRPRMAAGGCRV
jgi:hypothetical protein